MRAGKEFQGRAEVLTSSVFVLILGTSQLSFAQLFLKFQDTKHRKSGEAFYLVMEEKGGEEEWKLRAEKSLGEVTYTTCKS